MKKGFSLIEIIVVMVVIGIIVALGIKGGALVNTSRMRTEIAKLRNFEIGFSSYYLKHNALPPKAGDNVTEYDGFTCYVTNKLLEKNVVLSEDVPSTFTKGSEPWRFCTNIAVDNATKVFVPAAVSLGDVDIDNVGAYAEGLNDELICNIEGILDDNNLKNGAGRVLAAVSNVYMNNCDQPSNKGAYDGYLYIAFSPNSQIPIKK
ncbi:MAG: prepilin-type N-terminal cleavage/methylation domain-containing protein [Deferribacteraceae bacterium]|nr:prepilin-type N-terminal cleavage/methylation domain-containing protein [Deferribacteraceae bacterium]